MKYTIIAIAVLCTLSSVSFSSVQAQGNLGCIQISSELPQFKGQFDLDRGIYTEFQSPQTILKTRFGSLDGKYILDTSQDPQYMITNATGTPQYTFNLEADFRFIQDISPIWSPDGRSVAIIAESPQKDQQLVIASPYTKSLNSYVLHAVAGEDFNPVVWSPDNQYVAVSEQYNGLGNQEHGYFSVTVSLFNIDGSTVRDVAKDAYGFQGGGEQAFQQDPFRWSADGNSVYFVQNVSPTHTTNLLNAMVYHISNGHTDLLAKNLSDFPSYQKGGKYSLVQWESQGVTNAGLLDTEKSNVTSLDSGKSAFYEVWLGSTAFIAQSTYLILLDTSKMVKHRLDISPAQFPDQLYGRPSAKIPASVAYLGVTQFSLSGDGRWLIFVTDDLTGLKGNKVWVVDLSTGNFRTFANLDISTVGRNFFISTNSQTAVLLGAALYVLPLDQDGAQPSKVNLGIPSDQQPDVQQVIWSPDSSLFAVLPHDPHNLDLFLVKRDGTILRHYNNFPDLSVFDFWEATWSSC